MTTGHQGLMKVAGGGLCMAVGLLAAWKPGAAVGLTAGILALGIGVWLHLCLAQRGFTPLLLSIAFVVAAFIPALVPGDAMAEGLDANRAREIGLLLLGLMLVGGYALRLGLLRIDWTNPAFLLVSSFVLWVLVSSSWSMSYSLSIAKSIEFYMVFIAAAIIASVAARTFESPAKLASLLTVSLAVVVLLFLAINVIIWETPLHTEMVAEYGGMERFTLGYAHPLAVADLLSITVICLFASGLNKRFKALLFLSFVALLYLTRARGATAALVVALLTMALFRIRNLYARISLGTGIILSTAYIFSTMFDVMDVATSVWGDDVQSLNGRTDLWSYTVPLILEKPITGYGYYANRFVLLNEYFWAGHAHNSFLEITLATGLVGLVLLSAFTIYLFYTVIKRAEADKGLLLGLAIFCYMSGMLNPLIFVPGIPMFILLIGLVYTSRLKEQAEAQRRAGARWGVCGVQQSVRYE